MGVMSALVGLTWAEGKIAPVGIGFLGIRVC